MEGNEPPIVLSQIPNHPLPTCQRGQAKDEREAAPEGWSWVWVTMRQNMPGNEWMREQTLRGESE